MPEILYHLTTDAALESILRDKVLKPGEYMKEIYFSDNIKDCLSLTGKSAGDAYIARQYNAIYKNKSHIFHLLVERGLREWKDVTPSYPVLVIPIERIGEIKKQAAWPIPGVEYYHVGEIPLPCEPEIIRAETYTYKALVPVLKE